MSVIRFENTSIHRQLFLHAHSAFLCLPSPTARIDLATPPLIDSPFSPSLPPSPPVTWRLAVTRLSLSVLWQSLSGAPWRHKRSETRKTAAAPHLFLFFLGITAFFFSSSIYSHGKSPRNPLKLLVNDTLLNGLFLVTHCSDEWLEAGCETDWCCSVVNEAPSWC